MSCEQIFKKFSQYFHMQFLGFISLCCLVAADSFDQPFRPQINRGFEIITDGGPIKQEPIPEAIVNATAPVASAATASTVAAARVSQLLKNPFNLQHKVVHLDLKESPPKIGYYSELLPYLKQLGATGLLIDYDSMFPYEGILQSIRGAKAYSQDDIKSLVRLARDIELEIIPLIHTFGHMKFLLGEKEFFDLREVISKSDFICPSAYRTHEILQEMIDQVLKLHVGTKWVHIGSDQVLQLGTCTRCTRKKMETKMDNNRLFLDHVKRVSNYIREKYHLNVLMWDDMLQAIPKEVLLEMDIPNSIIPMLWKFDKNVTNNKPFWESYLSTFPKLWIASAFSGLSDVSKQTQQDMKAHLDSHSKWVDLMRAFNGKFPMDGMALTGWQNFNHFPGLSNLLAVNIPSLALDLLFVNNGGLVSERLFNEVTSALNCNQPLSLDWKIGKGGAKCEFPGSEIFSAVEKYEGLKSKMEQAEGQLGDFLKGELASVEKTVSDAFKNVFFDETLHEWQNAFLNPIKTMLGMVDAVDLPAQSTHQQQEHRPI